jgi:ubiquinone/menaquinone biosynthesis C-methylase UbiE
MTTSALRAAVDLDLFTAIAEGADTPETLGPRVGAAVRGARTLADYLTVRGFLEKQDGSYRLTPSSTAFLDRRSPAYMGSMVDFLASPEMIALAMTDPASAVRAGGTLGLANVANDNPIWVKFARAMGPVLAPSARFIAEGVAAWPVPPRRVLDIAAGHGMFGIAVAQAVPAAQVTAVDWGVVLDVARENAERHGVMSRYRTLSGSAFEADWGDGFDLVLLPNFLHHFEPETCVILLRKVRASLSPAGRVLVIEFVPNADRVSPPDPAAFSYVMLLTTPHGDAYTADQYRSMAVEAGFAGISTAPIMSTPHTMVEFLR